MTKFNIGEFMLILSFLFVSFFVSCSQEVKKENKEEKEIKTESNNYCPNINAKNNSVLLDKVVVEWMYMDDSLRTVCKNLNYILPWMESSIKELPEKITFELQRFSILRNFELMHEENGKVNDSLHFYLKDLVLDNCDCRILRYYSGNNTDKNFDGYKITEQIICNAKDKTPWF